MDILKNKSDQELLASIIAEIAKTTNELKCARADTAKASSRLAFALAVAHELINRKKD